MAVRQIDIPTSDLDSGVQKGDAAARTHPSMNWAWNNSDTAIWVGTDAKAVNPENVMFLRYDIRGAAPASETFDRARIELVTPPDSRSALDSDGDPGEGFFRVGFLLQDGIWDHEDAVGWAAGVGDGKYASSFDLPFPTAPSDATDAITPGVTYADAMWGPFAYADDEPLDYVSVGDRGFSTEHRGIPGVVAETPGDTTWDATGMAALINAFRALGWTHVAFVFDAYDVPAAPDHEFITFRTDDDNTLGLFGKLGPHLVLEYDVVDEVRSLGSSTDAAVHHVGKSVNPSVSSVEMTTDTAVSSLSAAVSPAVRSLGATVDPAVSRIT